MNYLKHHLSILKFIYIWAYIFNLKNGGYLRLRIRKLLDCTLKILIKVLDLDIISFFHFLLGLNLMLLRLSILLNFSLT